MVMELMSCSLTAFIEKKPFTVDTTIKRSILLDVALGLNYLHTQNPSIIHRDLSPNNIMLSLHDSGHVAKIGDLGVAKVIRADSKATKSKLTSVPGTVAFMPPEALLDDAVYDVSLDVFSFGGITLHVITEEWPTPGAATQFDKVTRTTRGFNEVERRQKYLDKMSGNVANSLKTLVERCLDDDKSVRPTMAAATKLLEDLPPTLLPTAQNEKCAIKWTKCPDLPYKMKSASVATNQAKNKVYVMPKSNSSKQGGDSCFSQDIKSKQWKELPQTGYYYCTLLLCKGDLNAIGGYNSKSREISPKIFTFFEDSNRWVSNYPDMLTAKVKPGVAEYLGNMIIAGGSVGKSCITNSIEILNCQQKPFLWKTCAVRLPKEMWNINLVVHKDYLYTVGFCGVDYTSADMYRIPAGAVLVSSLASTRSRNYWIPLPAVPHIRADVACVGSLLIAVGGSKSHKVLSEIFSFDTINLVWKKIGALTSVRADVAVCALSNTTIMAVGGYSKGGGCKEAEKSSLSTVEVGEIEFDRIKTDESCDLTDHESDSKTDEDETSSVCSSEISNPPPLPLRPSYENVNGLNNRSPPPLPPRASYQNVERKLPGQKSFSQKDDDPPPLTPPAIKPRTKRVQRTQSDNGITHNEGDVSTPRLYASRTEHNRPPIPPRCTKVKFRNQVSNSSSSSHLSYPPKREITSSKHDSPVFTLFKEPRSAEKGGPRSHKLRFTNTQPNL